MKGAAVTPAIAVIPARGGSKGIPGKNLRPLGGKPLIVWTIEAARKSKLVDRVIVSTDDEKIAAVAVRCGAEVVRRPPELARDDSPSEDALRHVIEHFEGGEEISGPVVFLQATSPFRADDDIDRALTLFRDTGADSLLSVVPSHAFLWEEHGGEARPVSHDYRQRKRRQEMKSQYRENGSIYIFKPALLLSEGRRLGGKVVLYRMSEDAGVDIDSELDFMAAEMLMSRKNR